MEINVSNKSFWFSIRVVLNREKLEFMKWDNMRMDTRLKYDWYFKYRAALLQIKYPRAKVETAWGSEEPTGRTKEQLLKAKIRGKKATITKFNNLLNEYVKKRNSLFPLDDDPSYQNALRKIQRLESELESMESQKT